MKTDKKDLEGEEESEIDLRETEEGLISSHCCSLSWHSVLWSLAHAQCTSILNAAHRNYMCSPYSVFVAITS